MKVSIFLHKWGLQFKTDVVRESSEEVNDKLAAPCSWISLWVLLLKTWTITQSGQGQILGKAALWCGTVFSECLPASEPRNDCLGSWSTCFPPRRTLENRMVCSFLTSSLLLPTQSIFYPSAWLQFLQICTLSPGVRNGFYSRSDWRLGQRSGPHDSRRHRSESRGGCFFS